MREATLATIDVLLVNYNNGHLLDELARTLASASSGIEVDLLVVDNASTDGSAARLPSYFPSARIVVNDVNVGFGRANNQLLPHAKSDYLLLLNTDAFVAPDALVASLDYMAAHPQCGVLGARLVGRDGGLQPSCRYFPTPTNVFLARTGLARFFPWLRGVDAMDWDHATARSCDWVPGCYYLVRRAVVERVGLFDPRYFLYFEEVDHCKRVKAAGWTAVYCPQVRVVHLGGESAKSSGALTESGRQLSALQIESEMLYFRKHHGRLGLAWHAALTTLADGLLAAKAVLKGRGADVTLAGRHLRLFWRLVRATRFATQATR